MSTVTHKSYRASGVIGVALAILIILTLVVFAGLKFFPGNGEGASANFNPPSPTASATSDPDLAQCRVDAVLAYMQAQGFQDGDYVIGEENIDLTASELNETGSLAFGQNGANVLTRDDLQAVFDSEDSVLQKVVDAQVAKFPSLGEETLLDAQNWEIVQMKVESRIVGNTGLVGDAVVSMGTRESAAGEGAWLFIDTATCTVAVAEVQPETAKPGDPPAVGVIRPGCINPADNIVPPPPPPPVQECPPDMPHGEWPVCKDDPSNIPATPPGGGGPSPDQPDPVGPPAGGNPPPVYQPPPPPPPAPGPPVGSEPDPAPAPAPQPSAPPPSNPVDPNEGNGCAPGLSSC